MIEDDLKTILDKVKIVKKYPDRFDDETKELVLDIADHALEALENKKAEPKAEDISLNDALRGLGREELIRKEAPPVRPRSRYPNSYEIAREILERDSEGDD